MTVLPFTHTPLWLRALRAGALGLSVAFHVALAWFALQEREAPKREEVWVEMAVVENKPAPEPEPEPEPEEPAPPPEPVDLKDTVKEPPPDQPPPEQQRTVRRVQGLSASSFAEGSGTGLSVRAGTTLATRAGDETLSIDEAATSIPYAAATVQPRLKIKPDLAVPDEIKDNNIEGVVKVALDIAADGTVTAVRVTSGLGYGADEACAAAWAQARYKPAMRGDQPIGVTNVPQRCTFKAIE